MFWDVLFAVGIGISQLALTWYGIHVSVRENRIRNAVVIGLVGVAGIGLTVAGTVRNSLGQEKLQSQIEKIQKNTEQPPRVEVNVPPASPAPKQHALVGLAWNTVSDGIRITRSPEHPELGWAINVACKNVGTAIMAKRVACGSYGGLIRADQGIPSKETLEECWNNITKQLSQAHRRYVDLAPGEISWGSILLRMQDVDPDLDNGNKVILAAGVILYSDEVGSHKKEFCEWAQPPFNPDRTVWHFCDTGHNREVY